MLALGIGVNTAMRLAGLGIGAWLLGALWGSLVLTCLLYGISSTDPLTFVLVPAALVAVAALAAAVPALRKSIQRWCSENESSRAVTLCGGPVMTREDR